MPQKTARRRRPETSEGASRRTLGGVLRALRDRSGWTLKEMSDRTSIPLSTLSKIEHDRLTLSYDKLQLLAQKLNMRMSDLFSEPEGAAEPTITARRSIGRLDQALQITTPNYDYWYLCPELRHKRMIPVHTRIRARTLAEFGDLVRHAGEEFILVLEGRVDVHTEFYDPVTLGAGESIYIDSNMGHAYVCAEGCEEVVLLGVCSAGEEDLMQELLNMHGDGEMAQAERAEAG